MNKKRCFGNDPKKKFYADYHDNEWGIPVYEDQRLFEMLILEGAQAGLSWETILQRREGYRQSFHQFNPLIVSTMTNEELELLRNEPKIIRNRLKIYAARTNAQVFLKIQQEFGSFSNYLWGFVDHKPILNQWKEFKEVPCESTESKMLSKDLKKRGMTFVGPTIMYAYMQAVGLVNDHLTDCWCYQKSI